jgi:hypothetical protein
VTKQILAKCTIQNINCVTLKSMDSPPALPPPPHNNIKKKIFDQESDLKDIRKSSIVTGRNV